jgi:glycosyltransferase involved in cell wall biosynthesis
MRLLAPLVGRTCDRILAISCAARDEVAAGLHLDPRKFDVTPLGITVGDMPAPAGDRALRERLGLGDEPIVLCVAAKRSHKNLHGLIRALAELPEPRPQLVLPGAPNEYERTLRELARELGVEHSVRLPGWVADADLDGLYRAATCFALASFVEGFGLPVLEAMARGVPVVCSDIPVLREVAADAALFFDPSSAASIAQAIARVNLDERMRAQLIERGHARCELFTWERTARATLESYRRALAER